MTQVELAEKLGVTQGVVSQFERGSIKRPKNTHEIAAALQMDEVELITGVSKDYGIPPEVLNLALRILDLGDDVNTIETMIDALEKKRS